jgi:hypothetical protein
LLLALAFRPVVSLPFAAASVAHGAAQKRQPTFARSAFMIDRLRHEMNE